ncbi:MAG: hypothetical protein EOP84_24600, partial [Verrucomicrobiaceae bacterium]
MSPEWTFSLGLLLLVLFGWYFASDSERVKRIMGTVLTVLLTYLCLVAVYPPAKKIPLGLDLRGGTSFLIRLVPEADDAGKMAAEGKESKVIGTSNLSIQKKEDKNLNQSLFDLETTGASKKTSDQDNLGIEGVE